MANFNQSELNSIRELATSHQMVAAKLNAYSGQCQDQKIKQMFEQASQQAAKSAQNLIQML